MQTLMTQHNDCDLQAQVQALTRRLNAAESRLNAAQRRSRLTCGLALTMVGGALMLSPGNRTAIAQGYGLTLQQLATRLSAVESKTHYMSANPTAKSTTFSGCNVYVQNGLGATSGNPNDPGNPATAVTNSPGNLIIG